MEGEKYERIISLRCPTCGGTDFESSSEEQDAMVKCNGCGREMTREALFAENAENIEEHKKEIIEEARRDLEKNLHDTLKRAFSGSRSFRIK